MNRDHWTPEISTILPIDGATRESPPEATLYESDAGKEREDYIDTPIANIDIITSRGGDQSKTEKNEDAYIVANLSGKEVILVMDGVGGHGGGTEPAQISRAAFHTYLVEHNNERFSTRDALTFIGTALHHHNTVDPDPRRHIKPVGVAAVIVTVDAHRAVDVAWSGDCKLLTIRAGEKFPDGTTNMHNLGAELEGHTDDYIWSEYRHLLTRFLGNDPAMNDGRSERKRFSSMQGDVLIVASDGLWDVVTETEALDLARTYRGQQLHTQLFALAHSRNNAAGELYKMKRADNSTMPHTTPEGNGDNITIAVVELK